MTEKQFKDRTKKIGLEVIQLVESLPKNSSARILGQQLLRSATSVGANYRSACRGRSAAEILSRMAIVEDEGDESLYWMEMLLEAGMAQPEKVEPIYREMNEIVAMTVASIKTLRARASQSKIQNPKSKMEKSKMEMRA